MWYVCYCVWMCCVERRKVAMVMASSQTQAKYRECYEYETLYLRAPNPWRIHKVSLQIELNLSAQFHNFFLFLIPTQTELVKFVLFKWLSTGNRKVQFGVHTLCERLLGVCEHYLSLRGWYETPCYFIQSLLDLYISTYVPTYYVGIFYIFI